MMRKILLVFFMFSSFLWAVDNEQAGFEFLRVDKSARAAALGGAFATISGDVHCVFYNPAGLITITRPQLQANYTSQLYDFKSATFGYAQSLKDWGVFSVNFYVLDYGEFQEIDILGNRTGTFGANDMLFAVGYSNTLAPNLSYGLSLNYVQSKIQDYNASAISVNGGLLYRIPDKMLNFGLSINHLGTALDGFLDDKEKLPTSFQLGVSKQLEHLPLIINAKVQQFQYNQNTDENGLYWALGGELLLSDYVIARLGFNSRSAEQKVDVNQDRFAGISFGLGIQKNKLGFNFSTVSYGILGSMTHFGLSYKF